jgi:anti-sigma B factor antagonist
MLDSKLEELPDGKAIITLTGSLTLGTSLSFLDSQVRHLLEGQVTDLTLNLAGVDYADSGGLGLLIHANGLMKAKRGILRLSNVRSRVMDLLRLTSIDTVITIENPPTPLPPQE